MKKTIKFLILLLLLSSCIKEEIELQKVNSDPFDPSFALPIGNVTMPLSRLTNQSNRFLMVNPTTGLLEFVFQSESVDLRLSDFFNIANQSVSSSTSMSATEVSAFNIVPTGTTYSFSSSNAEAFTVPASEQIDSILIKNGSLSIQVSSSYSHDISIVLTIPSLIKSGRIYTDTIPLTYTGTTPITQVINLSLSGYKIDLTDGGTTNNTLRFNFNTTLTKGAAIATTAESISFNSGFVLSEIDIVHGYFGNRTITESDTVEYDIFKNSFGGSVSLANPRIELELFNSTGVTFDAQFTSISAPDNTVNQNIGGPGLTSFPTITKANFRGDSTITNHTIDNSNTSPTITDVLNEMPSKLAFTSSVELNPGGITKNFFSEDSRLWANTKFLVPLDGRADGFELNDTNSTKLQDVLGIDSSDADNLNKLTLRLLVTNGIPVSTSIQAYFLDDNNNVLDSLFVAGSQEILEAGTVNFSVPTSDVNYGRVTSPGKKTVDVILTKEQYKGLLANNQAKILYSAKFNTIENAALKNVKFFPQDYIDIKVSAKVDLTLSLN